MVHLRQRRLVGINLAPIVQLCHVGGGDIWNREIQTHQPAAWAQDTGASQRTVARLFRPELGCTFTQWRQQVILAKAVSLAAGRMPVGQIATELGYSPSAFSAMVRKSVGQPPAQFLGQR